MLSQLEKLTHETDGRYATDRELKFLQEYTQSFALRAQTYQKLQAAEATVIQQVYAKAKAQNPSCFRRGNDDLTKRCMRDTLLTYRYSAIALLLNDPDSLQGLYLFWLQTIVRAFNDQPRTGLIFSTMQEVIKQSLAPAEAELFLPLLEMNRRLLGEK